ncbi:MAG: radical SAM family heme chaperone HemW [Chloroflexi bacterium]|nr:radical SAM family heme chaperone HemW [Chloroflexota bacterium]MCL5075627.1 radical SAM family heme chaperone HemW [Chloroflexota bacterium]
MSEKRLALYIHIPFCLKKCTYCDFNSYVGLCGLKEGYVEALRREVSIVAQMLRTEPYQSLLPMGTIYFGGGTPSLLDTRQIAHILTTCQRLLGSADDIEITLEANPGTINRSYLHRLRSLGINRLSLGIQSFDDTLLRLLGRTHTTREALLSYEFSRSAGFDNVNLDLIYGLPGQDLSRWEADLRRAVSLAPDHLSLYSLTLEPDTPLGYAVHSGQIALPVDDTVAEMYELAEHLLEEYGYEHYELSNWARLCPDHPKRCRHNLVYWYNEPYVGLGAGAHSCLGRRRYYNVLWPPEYVENIRHNRSAVAHLEHIDVRLEMTETIILGLRLSEGLSVDRFEERFHQRLQDIYGEAIQQAEGLGLLSTEQNYLRLTARGRLLSNEVFVLFLL